jgi:ABC-2 type transport system permease protein
MLNTLNKELKELFADKKIWIGIFLVLIIIIIGTSYNKRNPQEAGAKPLTLGVINNDDSSYSELLLNYFNSSKTFSSLITVVTGESEEMKASFLNGEMDIYMEIPKDFAMNMIQLQHSPVKVTFNIEDTTKAILFQNVLKSYEKYIAAVEANAVGLYEIMESDGMDQKLIDDTNVTISMDLIFTALGKETFFTLKPLEKFPITSVSDYYVISILVIALLYAGLYVGFRILREIRQGTFARLRTTQLPIFQFLSAKMLLMTGVYTVSVTTAISLLGDGKFTGSKLLFALLISSFSIILAIFLCAFFKTTQRYILVGNLLLFYCIVIGGGIIPIQFLPEAILNLSRITPNYYMTKGIILLSQGQMIPAARIMMGFLVASILLFAAILVLFNRRSVTNEEG